MSKNAIDASDDKTAIAIEQIREIYAAQSIRSKDLGFGRGIGVLVVDFQHIYTRGRAATGLEPVLATARLLDVARVHHCPVIYTVVAYHSDRLDEVLWLQKLPGLKENEAGRQETQVEELVAPASGDWVIEKEAASAFHGTGLAEHLQQNNIDTLIVCGTSTSGCVRASVVDGMAHGIRMIVARECVSDRSALLHEMSLFDMGTKYGDVTSLDVIIERLAGTTAAP